MSVIPPRTWNETDIPAVEPDDLAQALSVWLARERQGMVLVGDPPPATPQSIEAAVIALFDDPGRGLSVLYRLRCLIAALRCRRFHHLLRSEHAGALAGLVVAAASLRLNPTWGLSPVRLAWAVGVARKGERLKVA
jgi:hypothetical protein